MTVVTWLFLVALGLALAEGLRRDQARAEAVRAERAADWEQTMSAIRKAFDHVSSAAEEFSLAVGEILLPKVKEMSEAIGRLLKSPAWQRLLEEHRQPWSCYCGWTDNDGAHEHVRRMARGTSNGG